MTPQPSHRRGLPQPGSPVWRPIRTRSGLQPCKQQPLPLQPQYQYPRPSRRWPPLWQVPRHMPFLCRCLGEPAGPHCQPTCLTEQHNLTCWHHTRGLSGGGLTSTNYNCIPVNVHDTAVYAVGSKTSVVALYVCTTARVLRFISRMSTPGYLESTLVLVRVAMWHFIFFFFLSSCAHVRISPTKVLTKSQARRQALSFSIPTYEAIPISTHCTPFCMPIRCLLTQVLYTSAYYNSALHT